MRNTLFTYCLRVRDEMSIWSDEHTRWEKMCRWMMGNLFPWSWAAYVKEIREGRTKEEWKATARADLEANRKRLSKLIIEGELVDG